MRENYIHATTDGTDNQSILSRVASLFNRNPEIHYGRGGHYVVDLVGTGGAHLVSVVCENHDIPVFDIRNIRIGDDPIRAMVCAILETSPTRCAIVIDLRDNDLLQKVRARIINKHCDLRYRRVVFCLTDKDTTSGTTVTCIHVPGSIEDRMTLLRYHIPVWFRSQAMESSSIHRLRSLAKAMVDYDLFEEQVWRNVTVDGTFEQFLSTALYQVVRRVRSIDIGIDDGTYPSFEQDWRRVLAPRLSRVLATPPDAVCPGIHRVIPIGVSSSDAIQAMEVAIPKDIQDPYAVTVQSSAVDDRCGSIAITQPMRYTIVNVSCMINPGILVDVCRELRTGHRAVIAEVHSMNQQLSILKDRSEETHSQLSETTTQLSAMTEKNENTTTQLFAVRDQLTSIQHEMSTLVTRLTETTDATVQPGPMNDVHIQCSKKGCDIIVRKRFRSGKAPRQCSTCLAYARAFKART